MKFTADQSIMDFQKFSAGVYGEPNDRMFSLADMLSHQQRFAMRAIKGIRKGDNEKLKLNLLISFAFLASIANRLHINLEEDLWQRFPNLCSYCGHCPCVCKSARTEFRQKVLATGEKPKTLAEFQKMFDTIYPHESRSLTEAGIHLAEELGEISEAIHVYYGNHNKDHFDQICLEISDLISCIFGVANSAGVDVAGELALTFGDNCHVCHQAPCACSFLKIATIKT